MLADESDEVLRAIVFGPGFSPDQMQAASRELQRRRRGGADDEPAPPSSRMLDRGERDEPRGDQRIPMAARSPRWGGRMSLVVTAVFACGIGVLATAGYHGIQDRESPPVGSAPGDASSLIPVQDPNGGRTLYALPASEKAADQADIDRWFAGPQLEEDILPLDMRDMDASSSRFLDRLSTDAGVWIGRSATGDYCVIIALSDGVTSSASCAPPEGFARRGALIGFDDHTVFWDPSTVIVSTTQP